MLFIFGKREARIGKYIDREHICYPCKAFDRQVQVYRPYFHFCLIPVFPIGPKEWVMQCRHCGDETVLESVVKEYDSRTKTPAYLYSAFILFAGLAIFWFYWNKNTLKHTTEYVGNPVIGDVYTVRDGKNKETYSFLRITAVNGDTVLALHNTLDYGDFVSGLTKDDYFVKDDTMVFRRKELKGMLDNGEIYSVERGYGDGSDFNRIK